MKSRFMRFMLLAALLAFAVYSAPSRMVHADDSDDSAAAVSPKQEKKKNTPTQTATPTRTPTATPEPQKVDLPPLFLAETKGEVFLIHNGDKKKADPPQKVEKDDHILTGKDGKAYLEFQSGGTLEVGTESDMKINELDIKPDTFKARFLMAFGKIKTIIHKLTVAHSTFEIEAGGVVSGVRGTTFEVDYDKDRKLEATKTYDGTVYTQVNGKEQLVEKGFSMVVSAGGAPVLGQLSAEDVGDFVEFINIDGSLEKKKEILMKQLEKRLLEELTNGVIGKSSDGKTKMNFGHFGL
jgi:hypothetical protein